MKPKFKPRGPYRNPSKPAPILLSNQKEFWVYGRNSVRALFQKRPEAIIRAYVTEEQSREFPQLLKFLAQSRKAYHTANLREMDKITGSDHHGGVAVFVRQTTPQPLAQWLQENPAPKGPIVVLAGVENPHNIGAILRTCAHFGIKTLITDRAFMAQTSSAFRTAEGGAEFVNIVALNDESGQSLPAETWMPLLKEKGLYILATGPRGKSLTLKTLTKVTSPIALIMGEEKGGLPSSVLKLANMTVSLPGTGQVESLNVASATAGILTLLSLPNA